MKHVIAIAIVLCHSAMITSHAWCENVEGQKKPGKREAVSATAQQSNVALTVTAPSAVVSGAQARMKAVLENRGKEPARILVGAGHRLEVTVINSQGSPTPLTLYGKTLYPTGPTPGSAVVKVLPPGESIQEELELNRVFDLTLPDAYNLFVKRTAYISSGKALTLEVQKLSFKVSDPAP